MQRRTGDSSKKNVSKKSDWDHVASWYHSIVGDAGMEFHREIIFPGLKLILGNIQDKKILDLACGQGAFSRFLHRTGAEVTGIDLAPSLIEQAKKMGPKEIDYFCMDACDLNLSTSFDDVVSILAIQNIPDHIALMNSIQRVTKKGSRMIWVILHPCFRIPRQSSWGYEDTRKIQFRRIDRYMSPLDIPIQMHPGSNPEIETKTYHRPLSYYAKLLTKNNWYITDIEEWCSHKKSEPGKKAKTENRAREEFPVFLAIVASRF